MSFLEGVEGTRFPLLPTRFRCVLGARAWGPGPGAAAGEGGSRGLRPSCLRPPPAGPFLPSPPRGVALWPRFQWFQGSGTAVFANFPGKGGGMPLSRRAHGPRKPSRACQGLEGASRWRQFLGVQVHGPPSESRCRLRSPKADPTARPLQHPELGGRKMSVIAEEEERGKCWCSLPLSCCPGGVTHCQDCGLAQPVL